LLPGLTAVEIDAQASAPISDFLRASKTRLDGVRISTLAPRQSPPERREAAPARHSNNADAGLPLLPGSR